MNLLVHPSFDPVTGSWTYLLVNPGSGCCAIIDPVLDYDPATGTVATAAADRLCEVVQANGYTVEWILETHVHADHLSAAAYLKQRFVCAQTAIGEHVRTVQAHFADAWDLELAADGRQFDRLLGEGERICLGHTCGRVLHTPGHTPACVTYVFDRFAFIGDTLFMPDYGTARCDFPGGDARTLFGSVQRLYGLPAETRLLLCHDYPPAARTHRFCSTVDEQRRSNRMLSADTAEAQFVTARTARDRDLDAPRLLEPSLRANLTGGVLPGWRMPTEGRAA
ncbi:MAG: MBL fold metallo-hydrolase [Gammaproteobacteria bacterium]|nr:MBL fold metallo-hydrolase [Gammaproteobacteria bacterium]